MSETSTTPPDPVIHKDQSRRFRVEFTSSAWLYFALVCLIMSYLLIWQRGYYMDDYLHRNKLVDPVTNIRTPLARVPMSDFPVRMLSAPFVWVSLQNIPEHEFLVRTLTALIQGLNGFLLGLIIYRTLRSKLAAVAGGWLFLFPVFAAEAVLWTTATFYVCAATFALLFILAFQSALQDKQNSMRMPIRGAVAFAAMLFFFEAYVAVYGLVIMLGAATLAETNSDGRGRVFKRILIYMAASTIVLGLVALCYRFSTFVSARGGVDFNLTNLLARVEDYGGRLFWMTLSSSWGMPLLQGVFYKGLETLLSSWKGVLLLGAASILLVVTAVSWSQDDQSLKPRFRVGIALFITGVTWVVVTILFPGTLGKQQMLEYRMLYFPSAGASVAVASLLWLASRLLGSYKIWHKLLIGVAGLVMLLTSITMVGYAGLFAVRNSNDRNHVSSVVNAIPSEYVPEGTLIVPYKFDLGTTTSRRLLAGVFETPWSSRAALNSAYRRNDLKTIITNRWVDWRFTFDESASLNYRLRIHDEPVPIDRTLIIASDGGRALPIKSLSMAMKDGKINVVTFPLAENLSRHGIAVLETLSVQSRP